MVFGVMGPACRVILYKRDSLSVLSLCLNSIGTNPTGSMLKHLLLSISVGGASKAGLKDAKAKKHKRKAKKEEVMESSPGDLLGDLTAALGRRRKAMSGKDKGKDQQKEERKEEHNLGGGSMMDNISKMIPAPPGGGGGGGDQSGSEGGDSDEGAW